MKRLIIIVEGDTEKEFVNSILRPFLISKGVYDISCYKIKHSKGGLSKYEHLRKDIINSIYESNAIVTTLIDYYALPKDFPKYEDSKIIKNKNDRISFLEDAIKVEIQESQGKIFSNLHPYIQLHEFEALVFSSIDGIQALFEKNEFDFKELNNVIKANPNPETINDRPDTAPSKRLLKLIKGYDKVVDGVLILDEIGLITIRQKCLRFNEWLNNLIKILKD